MEQAKPQEAIIPSSVRAKAPRPAEMMTAIEVETDCSNLVIEGWTVPAGVCQVTAPVDMLKRVEAMVEKRHERIKQAAMKRERDELRAMIHAGADSKAKKN